MLNEGARFISSSTILFVSIGALPYYATISLKRNWPMHIVLNCCIIPFDLFLLNVTAHWLLETQDSICDKYSWLCISLLWSVCAIPKSEVLNRTSMPSNHRNVSAHFTTEQKVANLNGSCHTLVLRHSFIDTCYYFHNYTKCLGEIWW